MTFVYFKLMFHVLGVATAKPVPHVDLTCYTECLKSGAACNPMLYH